VVRLLGNVAGPAGTLLLLDDLQWAGPDALDLLTALVRAATEVPLRVIGAYRTTEVGPGDPLGILLADLAHAGLAPSQGLKIISMATVAVDTGARPTSTRPATAARGASTCGPAPQM
jgi:hypothetical protein